MTLAHRLHDRYAAALCISDLDMHGWAACDAKDQWEEDAASLAESPPALAWPDDFKAGYSWGRRIAEVTPPPALDVERLADILNRLGFPFVATYAATIAREYAATPPSPALDVERLADGEDAKMLAQAATHLLDHIKEERPRFYCEDIDNVRHFAAKVLAATPPTDKEPSR